MRHPLFATICTLSAAIAYAAGWRVARPRDWSLKLVDGLPVNAIALPLTWRDDMGALTLFFAAGGELEHLAHQQRFRDRRSIAEHLRMMERLFGNAADDAN